MGNLPEFNEHSTEYRMVLDYIGFYLTKAGVNSVVIAEESAHFTLGLVRRLFYSDIKIYCSDKIKRTVSSTLGEKIYGPVPHHVDAIILPLYAEGKDWEDKLNSFLRNYSIDLVVIGFKIPSYKILLGAGFKSVLNPFRLRRVLNKNGYGVIEEVSALHPKYLLYSLLASFFGKIGRSALHFKFSDKALNHYMTNSLLGKLGYVQIYFAKRR